MQGDELSLKFSTLRIDSVLAKSVILDLPKVSVS